jgi:outer membrane protein assembly factor BamB
VLAFDHSGKQLWQADVGSKLNGWGSAASLVLSGDLVIVNASIESESLVALNKKTGKEAWRAEGIRAPGCALCLSRSPAHPATNFGIAFKL